MWKQRHDDRRFVLDGSHVAITFIIGVLTIALSGASAAFAWRQAEIARRAPIEQALAVQRITACGQIMSSLTEAQSDIFNMVRLWGGRAVPADVVAETLTSVLTARKVGQAGSLFFERRDLHRLQAAVEAVDVGPVTADLADDGILNRVTSDRAEGLFNMMQADVEEFEQMCRGYMYPIS